MEAGRNTREKVDEERDVQDEERDVHAEHALQEPWGEWFFG